MIIFQLHFLHCKLKKKNSCHQEVNIAVIIRLETILITHCTLSKGFASQSQCAMDDLNRNVQ